MDDIVKITKYHVTMTVEVITEDEEAAAKFMEKQITDGLEGVHDIKDLVVHKIKDEASF